MAAFYMVGAFAAAFTVARTGSFAIAAFAAVVAGGAYALLTEVLVVQHLYRRPHLDQVLATFGVTLFTNELCSLLFGRTPALRGYPAAAAR